VMNVEIFKIEFIVFNGNVIMCLTSIIFNISLFKMSKLQRGGQFYGWKKPDSPPLTNFIT
jgi:hypothetical protein